MNHSLMRALEFHIHNLRTPMNTYELAAARQQVEQMAAAVQALIKGARYLRTAEAIELSPIAISAETLLGYPDYVMPRLLKNPRARKPVYLWDPRDLVALPHVLERWQTAIAQGPEAESEFAAQRRIEIEARFALSNVA